ncbi:putative peptide/nitrate transporter [Acorus gramineus]|uniref:Peptide/nitrate transporter n=1 Tax=Acorus gramineus TaxID=55184 RepID=A0AAV8ZZT5_ACOGR|nr:putative peptide/nitrate transporter [Acorus gramineus]
MHSNSSPTPTQPLLDEEEEDLILSDDPNRPIPPTNGGGWTSAIFIIGVEIAERFAYYGISSNLISYLTGPLGESTATAAANVNAWSGVASLLPLLGAFVADSWLGRYRTILVASLRYILSYAYTRPMFIDNITSYSFQRSTQVALAQGGHKPCAKAFGADQFDSRDPEECKSKSSFFNWWYFWLCSSSSVSISIVNYIQDNINWTIGFGVPNVSMMFALVIFLLGTRSYRHNVLEDKGPFVRISQVIVASMRRRQEEIKRLDTAKEFGLIDKPNSTILMRFWWLVPQYVLYGISKVFTMVGLQEFFYDQVPAGLRSLGLALYLSIFGMGNFISSFLVLLIDWTTGRRGESWFSNNLNRAHLDYFYWLLAGLSIAELVIYIYFANSYIYKKVNASM